MDEDRSNAEVRRGVSTLLTFRRFKRVWYIPESSSKTKLNSICGRRPKLFAAVIVKNEESYI